MGLKSKIKRVVRIFQRDVVKPVYIPVFEGSLLKSKNILITGGSGGIGKAIAEVCLKNGASVILTGRNQDKLLAVKEQLEANRSDITSKVMIMTLDISNVSTIKEKLNKTISENSLDKIDALINNAGISTGASIGNTKEADFDKVLDTNLKGTYFMSQEFANYLIENNIPGNILNISSVSGIRPAVSPYMLSKWGETGLTKGMAKKYIKHNIVVNGIAPGPTATDMLKKDGSDLMYKASPAKRFVDSVEIANLAVFMISDMGRMIVGDTVYITGGCGNLTFDDLTY